MKPQAQPQMKAYAATSFSQSSTQPLMKFEREMPQMHNKPV